MKTSIFSTLRLAMMALFLTAALVLGGCDMDGNEGIDDGVGIEEGLGEDELGEDELGEDELGEDELGD
jgi:hypothetical protein